MDNVKDWSGLAPVAFNRVGFAPTKELLITDADGDWYGLTDGKQTIKVALVTKSPEKSAADGAADLAAKPEVDKRNAEFAAIKFWSDRISDLPLMNDDEWAQLTQNQRVEHLRNVMVGVLGQRLQANILLDAEAEKEPGLFSKLWGKFFG